MDAEIIIIIVAVALSILSGINKNKKKKAAHTGQPYGHSPAQEPDDDPWSTIRRYIEDAQAGEILPVDESGDIRYHGRMGQGQREESDSVENHKAAEPAGESFTKRLNKYAGNKRVKDRHTNHKEHDSGLTTQVTDSLEEREDIMHDFDLTKAVIYSEILRPKYDEF